MTSSRAGLLLASGLALTALAALAPAGLARPTVPAWSWAVLAVAFAGGAAAFRLAGSTLPQLVRRLGWLVPFVLVLALPAALLAPSGRRLATAGALAARALAATAASASATAAATSPGGQRRARGPKATSSSTVRPTTWSSGSAKTMPTLARTARTVSGERTTPSTVTRPCTSWR